MDSSTTRTCCSRYSLKAGLRAGAGDHGDVVERLAQAPAVGRLLPVGAGKPGAAVVAGSAAADRHRRRRGRDPGRRPARRRSRAGHRGPAGDRGRAVGGRAVRAGQRPAGRGAGPGRRGPVRRGARPAGRRPGLRDRLHGGGGPGPAHAAAGGGAGREPGRGRDRRRGGASRRRTRRPPAWPSCPPSGSCSRSPSSPRSAWARATRPRRCWRRRRPRARPGSGRRRWPSAPAWPATCTTSWPTACPSWPCSWRRRG